MDLEFVGDPGLLHGAYDELEGHGDLDGDIVQAGRLQPQHLAHHELAKQGQTHRLQAMGHQRQAVGQHVPPGCETDGPPERGQGQ